MRDYLPAPDIGFAFLPDYCSQGLAVESSTALLLHADKILRLPTILAIVSEGNAASERLLQKLGFAPIGKLVPPGETTAVHVFERATVP